MTYQSWRFNDMSQGVIAVPLWIPQLGYSGGLVILLIAFVDELVHVLRGNDPRYEKPQAADRRRGRRARHAERRLSMALIEHLRSAARCPAGRAARGRRVDRASR